MPKAWKEVIASSPTKPANTARKRIEIPDSDNEEDDNYSGNEAEEDAAEAMGVDSDASGGSKSGARSSSVNARVMIVLPELGSDRDDYDVASENSISPDAEVVEIIRHNADFKGKLSYRAKFADGTEQNLPFDRLIEIEGGQKALHRFSSGGEDSGEDSDAADNLEDTENAEESETERSPDNCPRKHQSRRLKPQTKRSANNKASEDDSDTVRPMRRVRNTRGTPRSQSARLSNVDTGDDSDKGPSTRSTRHSTRSRGNPSTTDDDEDKEPSSKRLHRSARLRDSLSKEDSEEEEDEEDEEQEEEEEPTRKRPQRATRSRRNPSTTDDSGEEPASKRPHRSTRLQGNSTRKENTEAEDDEEPEESTSKRPQRTTRSKGPLMEVEMLGYKSGSDDEDNSVIVLDTSTGRRTVTVPAKATRKTTRPRAKRKTREEVQTDDDISSEAEATRKSGRKRHKKTYVEPGLEDEFETVEIKKSTQPRVIHSKETFQVLDDNSDFVRIHNTQCATCGIKSHSNDRGQLICCQGCTATYHKLCLGHRAGREHLVTKIGEDNFVLQCKRCIGRQKMKDPLTASLDRCTECHEQGTSCAPFKNPSEKKKPTGKALDARAVTPSTEVSVNLINNSENILFRCIGCHRAWHYDHLVARGPKPSKKEKITDVRTQRIMQYKFDYKCTDCLKYEGKIVIVAWRPADKEHHIPGEIFELTDFPEDEREYLVKQEDESYFHVDWMPGPWVAGAYTHRKTGFSKGRPIAIFDDDEAIPESYLRIDIVFDVEFKGKVSLGNDLEADLARINDVESAYMKFIGLDYNEVFWDKPPEEYEEERYQDWKRAYEDYIRGFYVKPATRISQKIAQTRKINFKKLEIKEQPEYIKHGTLMKYQLNGLNWLYYKWHQGDNGILADEMGLGKTVQIVAFLSVLCEEQKIWPFLIIVPQATVPNWRREIQNWAPNIRVVVYAGTDVAKTIVRDYEMFHDNGDLKCHVVVTSYDTALSDAAVLRKIPWQGLVVDEGQRLKNAQSLLYQELSQWKFNHKVLLSGTPLQNNFRELFNLLHFIDPKEINAKELEEEYGDGNLTNENAPKMLELIKPYFLRRTKAEVLTHLPPMAEVIVPVSMSALQRKLYKSVLSKDTSLIRAILSRDKKSKQIEAAKLANLLMQLRKCVSHPFIYNKEIEERTTDDPEIIHRNLVEASSKLGLLNIMLPKLKERGHRVLIFSQFLDMLDVMEDFLRGHDLKYHRLDGKLKAMDKQKGIDEFNSADTETFAFLLSTRAGGVGINLATADTVIILDPDYNPFQDIQAISRAHRIGQKDKVLVFKIVTRDTVEEKIVQIGKKKLSLAHIITDKMNNSSDDNGPTVSDIESILSYGAKKLFEDDEDESVIKYDDKSIDKLLDRSHIEATKPTDGDGEIAGEQPFSFARVWANDKGELEEEDADDFEKPEEEAPPGFWERVLEEREEEARREAEAQREELGRGRRKRNVNYILQADKEDEVDNVNDSDFSVHNSESEESQSGQDGMPPTSYDVSMDMDLGPAPAPAAPPTGLLAQDKPKVKRSRKKVFQYQLEMDMDIVPTPSPGPPPGMPAMGVFPPNGPPPGQFPPGILPPGQFPPGQFPPGQFPPGQLPPGQFPPGQFPPDQFPPGAFPPGQFPPGQFPQGQLPPGQFPPGQFPPGQFPPGQFPPGQFPPGVFPPGQFPPGQFPQGQFPPGQFPPGQFPPGQFPPGHLPPGQLPPNFQQPLQQPVQQQFTQAPPATPISAPAPAPQVTPAQPINQAPQASPYGSPYGLPTPYGVSSPYAAAPPAPLCAACALSHPPGFCPLKQQPIQQCYFCKIAHFAGVSNCPHFNDLQQIQIMLEVLDAPNVTYADGVVNADIEEARLFLKMRRDEVLKGLDDELKRIDGQKGQNVPGTGRPPGMVGQVVQTQQTQQAQRAAKAKGKEKGKGKEVAPPTPADPAPAPAQAQAVPNAHTQTAQPKGAGNEIAKAHAMAEEARKMAEQMRSQKLQASATPPVVPAQLANPAQPAQPGQPVQSSQKPVCENAFTAMNGKPSMQIKDVSKETADRVKAKEQQKLKEREKKDAAGAEPNMPSLYRNTINALKILKSASTSAAGSPAPETAAQAVAQEPEPRDSPGVGQLSQTAAQLAITEESRAQDQAKEKEKGKSKEQETDGQEVSRGKGKGKEVVENIAGKDVMVIDLDNDEEMGDGPGAQLFNEASAASSPHVMRKKRT